MRKIIVLCAALLMSFSVLTVAMAERETPAGTNLKEFQELFTQEPRLETKEHFLDLLSEEPSLESEYERIGDYFAHWLDKFTSSKKNESASIEIMKMAREQALYHYNNAYSRNSQNRELVAKLESVSPPITAHTLRVTRLSKEGETGSGIDFNLNFETNSHSFTPSGTESLNTLADYLKENETVRISLEGHTDNIGTEKYNLGLSKRRAENSKAYLVSRAHIAPSRIVTRGWGNSRPKDTENDISWINRRVEMIKLSE